MRDTFSEMVGGMEIMSDGRTVWVNGSDGGLLGRFSRAGIDIHHPVAAQVETGKQCLNCKPGPTDGTDWTAFRDGMRDIYGAEISDRHTPDFLKVPA